MYSTQTIKDYTRVHFRLLQVFISHESSIIWRRTLHQSICIAKVQSGLKKLKAVNPGWLTNLSPIFHNLCILTANVTMYVQY